MNGRGSGSGGSGSSSILYTFYFVNQQRIDIVYDITNILIWDGNGNSPMGIIWEWG